VLGVEKLRLAARFESESDKEVGSCRLDDLGTTPLRPTSLDSEHAQAVLLEEAELVTAERTRVGKACDSEAQRHAETRGADAPFIDPHPRLSVRHSKDTGWEAPGGHSGTNEEHGRLLPPGHVRADIQLSKRQDR
jgi:hypothetical protein